MYPNIRAEMARHKITLKMIADEIGSTVSTASMKLNGHSEFNLAECKAIKALLKTDMPLEKLFEKDDVA